MASLLRPLLDEIVPWLSGLRSPRGPSSTWPSNTRPSNTVRFDDERAEYVDTQCYRGFPVGGIGAGGFGVGTAGGFCDLRANNNWMRPLKTLKGSFFALHTRAAGGAPSTTMLRRVEHEYAGVRAPNEVRFHGALPCFRLSFPALAPVVVDIEGFTPLVPHDVERSCLPLVLLSATLTSTSEEPVRAALALSFDNTLGRGGTGQLGIHRRLVVPRVNGRVIYDDTTHNRQEPCAFGELVGLAFECDLAYGERDPRQSALGRYLVVADARAADEISLLPSWDAAAERCAVVDELAAHGRLSSSSDAARLRRPAGAVCAHVELAPREQKRVPFVVGWWTPAHVTRRGVVAGHHYRKRYPSLEHVVARAHDERDELLRASRGAHDLLEETTLPAWLKRALVNSADSVLTNSVLPDDGKLYTIEGVDWAWPFGGLTGTCDQRLSSHPYTQAMFPSLDESELATFARLTMNGEVPHGNGNCDVELGTVNVPYGIPLTVGPVFQQKPWPDLTLSWILQAFRLTQSTGSPALVDESFNRIKEMAAFLARISRHGVPEGGTTYDTFSFPGTFSYTAILALAGYRALAELGREGERDLAFAASMERAAAAVQRRVEEKLWDERGFFRTSPRRPTLFFGTLAGEWMARRSGLGPLFSPTRTRSHLRHAHRVLVEGRRRDGPAPFVSSEAFFHGAPRKTRLFGFEVHGYAWQVVSYHALACIHVGLVDEGLATLRVLYERMWRGGYPWSADLYGNAGASYMTHPVLWALPDALSGVAVRAPSRVMHVCPRPLPDGPRVQRLPVFQPRFWGILEVERGAARAHLHVTRTFGAPLVIEHVVDDDGGGVRGALTSAVELSRGSVLALPLSPDVS